MHKKSVLIIEDEVELNQILIGEFHELNYIVYSANNIQEALHILRHSHVDLVLSDIHMPGGIGTELMKFATTFINPSATIVFMTGAGISENEITKLGGHALVRKPFSLDSITQLVQNLIR